MERPTPPPGAPRELPQVFGDPIKSGPRGGGESTQERKGNKWKRSRAARALPSSPSSSLARPLGQVN